MNKTPPRRACDARTVAHVQASLTRRQARTPHAHFREQLPRLYELPEPSRALIKLLDQETTYKHLVERHDEREGRHLYPALAQLTADVEREDLLARLFELKPEGRARTISNLRLFGPAARRRG